MKKMQNYAFSSKKSQVKSSNNFNSNVKNKISLKDESTPIKVNAYKYLDKVFPYQKWEGCELVKDTSRHPHNSFKKCTYDLSFHKVWSRGKNKYIYKVNDLSDGSTVCYLDNMKKVNDFFNDILWRKDNGKI